MRVTVRSGRAAGGVYPFVTSRVPAFFNGGDLVHAALVTAPAELRGDPRLDDLAQEHLADLVAGEAQDIGVIVVAGDVGAELIVAQGGPNAADLIGRDAHTQAGRADQDRPVHLLLGDRFGNHVGQIRVVDGRGTVGPHVHTLVSHLARQSP